MTKKMKNTSMTIKKNRTKKNRMDKMETYVLETDVENNTNTVIKYYKLFNHNKINDLLKEAHENLELDKKEDLGFFTDDAVFINYVMWLVAVRFTSLSKDVPKDLKEQASIMEDMVGTGLLERIHDEVLDQSEVFKVVERINKLAQLTGDIERQSKEIFEQLEDTVENPEIFNLGKNKDVIHPLVNPEKSE